MKRRFYICFLTLSCFVFGCQSGLMNSLVSSQSWSENYATLDGATCTSPEMIDGELETVGTSGHRIFVTLPTRKSIHRIVIRGTNIEDVIIYAGLGSSEGEWKILKQVKNNTDPTMDVRVRAATDRIRLIVGGTFDDKPLAGAFSERHNAVIPRVKRGRPMAQEIELYGFADKNTQEAEEMEIVEQQSEEQTEEAEEIDEEMPEF